MLQQPDRRKTSAELTSADRSESLNRFIVFVPYCDTFAPYIKQCIQSIHDQQYDNLCVVIVNDGGTLPEGLPGDCVVLQGDVNRGPAWSKWTFVNHVATNDQLYSPNDVVLILDGDDELTPGAIHCINNTYNNKKCWCTFGEASGKFCDQSTQLISRVSFEDMRNEQWCANHPRSFKAFMCKHFKPEHFKYKGEWLRKCTDRELMYLVFETAGNNKISYIDRVNYNYREHQHNSYKTVSSDYKQQVLDNIIKQPKHARVLEDIHVVMCEWKRVNNIPTQLKCLSRQTVTNRVHLHILNNNTDPRAVKEIEHHVEQAHKSGVINSMFHVHVKHCDNKNFGFERFLYIRDHLLPKYLLDYVVIIDDDQAFSKNWLKKIWQLRFPGVYTGWLCKRWKSDNIDYWDGSTVTFSECRIENQPRDMSPVHYVGTGGSLIDTRVFQKESQLWDLPEGLPHKTTVLNIEDLWLSYVAYKQNYMLIRSLLPEMVDFNNHDKESHDNRLYVTLEKQKQVLLEYLNDLDPSWIK